MLEFKDVNLCYVKDYSALYKISVKLEKGKIYNLVGDTGSGKASFLRCVAKLENTYEGVIEYDGQNIQEIDYSSNLNVGLVPEVPVLLERKDVVENLKYVIHNRKITENEEDEKYLINQVTKSFELDNKINIKTSKLDYFSKQKIAFARLSLRKIDVLLVENIFELINEDEINIIKDYILKYFADKNAIIVLASSKPLIDYFPNIEMINISAGMIKKD